jgi:hypothetical protein
LIGYIGDGASYKGVNTKKLEKNNKKGVSFFFGKKKLQVTYPVLKLVGSYVDVQLKLEYYAHSGTII